MFEGRFQRRLNALNTIVILIFIILIGRLGYLQITEGKYYANLAEGNRIRLIPIAAPRGVIYDRNGVTLVSTRPGSAVSFLEVSGTISDEVISKLAKIISATPEEIKEKLKQHRGGFDPIKLKTDIGPEIVAMIEERRSELPGVVIEIQPNRSYAYNELAAHVFGYISEINEEELNNRKGENYKVGDLIGKFGLEKYYDKELKGSDGGKQVEVDANGRPVQVLGKKDPIPGNNLFLTLDFNIQKAAEQAVDEHLLFLRKTINNPKAHSAAVVVLNPNNGEILALVSRPSFNPNFFPGGISVKEWKKINENPYNPMSNKAIAGEYPPGSTFKVVTGIAALESGKVTPDEKFFDSGAHWIVPKGNAGGAALGWIDFRQGLYMSNNVYFYEMGNRLGIDNLEKYARAFGLGKTTGIDLPGESRGLVANRQYKEEVYQEDWYISETFDAAIGQGFQLTTPLQMAMVLSQVATNGNFYKPHLVKKITSASGKTIRTFEPELISRAPISPANTALVRAALRDAATLPGGTSSMHFSDFPIAVAGKTGTAENPHGTDHAWFMAFAPYENPQIVIVVLVDQGGFGSVAAAPIAKKILENIFNVNQPLDR